MSTFSTEPTAASVSDPSQLITPVINQDQKSTLRTGVHVSWSLAAAAWLASLSLPLLLFPRLLSVIFASLLTTDNAEQIAGEGGKVLIRELNVLERSMAGFAGLANLALGLVLVVQSGALPLTSSLSASTSTANTAAQAPFRFPTIFIGSAYFFALAWFSYDLGFWLAAVPSGAVGVWGAWALLFAHEGRVNKVGGPNTERDNHLKNKMEEKNL